MRDHVANSFRIERDDLEMTARFKPGTTKVNAVGSKKEARERNARASNG